MLWVEHVARIRGSKKCVQNFGCRTLWGEVTC